MLFLQKENSVLRIITIITFLFTINIFSQTTQDDKTQLCVGILGDYIWHDSNVDGMQDQDELGIANVIIELLDSTMSAIDTTISDENGIYQFSQLAPGTYTVKISDDNFAIGGVLEDSENKNWYLSPNPDGSESNLSVTIDLNDEKNLSIDFGFFYSCMIFHKTGPDSVTAGDIINYNFIVENCGDVVLHGGVSVYDSLINPEGDHLLRNAVVQPRTVWEFSASYVSSKGDCGELVNNAWAVGHPVMPDDTKLSKIYDYDNWAVEIICDDNSTLGDRVWNDVNKNGIQDLGETGIADVGVMLYTMEDLLLDSTITDKDGFYLFEQLQTGAYYIQFSQPDGYTFTKKNVGEDRETDSDADENTGKTDLIEIYVEVEDLGWDAGLYSIEIAEFDLKLEMTVNNQYPQDEEEIFYSLKVTNINPVDGKNVEVTDLLPLGLDYLYSEPADYDTSNSIWYVGDLASGDSKDLNIHTKVNKQNLILGPSIDLGIASDFNLFVLKDIVQPSSDTEGKAAIGRDATFSNYSVGDKLPPSGGTEDVLIVGRKLTFTSGIVFGGNVVYGKYIDVPQYVFSVVDGSIRQEDPVPVDFNRAETELLTASSKLANFDFNGDITTQWGGLILTGTDPMLNTFEIDGIALSNANDMNISVPTGAVVVVNITGNNISWSGGLSVLGTEISNVLYNFVDATEITISGIDVRGTVLAPKAHINFIAGVINGQMICEYFEGQGQMNNVKFRGFIPGNPEITNCAEITYSEPTDTNKSNNSACVTIYVNSKPNPNNENYEDIKWELAEGYQINEMIWTMYQSNQGLLLGTVGGNIYLNSSSSSELINSSMEVGFIWSLFEENEIIYAGTDKGLFRYVNSEWKSTTLDSDVRSITSLGEKIYAAIWGKGVFCSEDNGESWYPMNNGLLFLSTQTLLSSSGKLYLGTFGGGILEYDFTNSIWKELSIEYKHIWVLASDEQGNIYSGTAGGGVYQSSDNGQNWVSTNVGLPSPHIYLIASYNNEVYAATWFGGIYKLSSSNPSSTTWQNIGMSGIQISSLSIDPINGTLYAATNSGDIYKSVKSIVGINHQEKTPTQFELTQNYPNPFNPSTRIKYQIPAQSNNNSLHIRLIVYDVLGREVSTLVNKSQSPGFYEVQWHASNIPSGIYFYRLTACNFNQSNKMILMK